VAGILGLFGLLMVDGAAAFTLNVVDTAGNPVSGFRWLVERDTTNQSPPGVPVSDSISLSIHSSHAPVENEGHVAGSSVVINVPASRRYFVSVLPDASGAGALRFTMSGAPVAQNQGTVTVTVHNQPIPTAQITILAMVDQNPISGGWTEHELAGGAQVIISDNAGQVSSIVATAGDPLRRQRRRAADGHRIVTTLTQDESTPRG
jgi:hypothetical protein